MAQVYSDPTRECDPYALPDAEVFHVSEAEAKTTFEEEYDGDPTEAGWYWWSCFPGCLPDGDPVGPFDTETEAITDAQNLE